MGLGIPSICLHFTALLAQSIRYLIIQIGQSFYYKNYAIVHACNQPWFDHWTTSPPILLTLPLVMANGLPKLAQTSQQVSVLHFSVYQLLANNQMSPWELIYK